MPHIIDTEKCTGCGNCVSNCPMEAIQKIASGKYQINAEECVDCQTCWRVCPVKASSGGPKVNLSFAR